GAVIVVLGILTWRQCSTYKNIETLWRDTIAKNPDCWLAHNNLGVDLRDHGRFSEAADEFREAIRAKPRYYEAENNLGESLLAQGELEEAALHIDKSLKISPGYIPAHWDQALVLARRGETDRAYAIAREGLRQQQVYLA